MTRVLCVVVADIEGFFANLVHTNLVTMLPGIPDLRFIIPDAVLATIRRPDLQVAVNSAIDLGALHPTRLEDLGGLLDHGELCECTSKAEASCLALTALNPDWLLASDQRGTFRRIALGRLEASRILNTPRLILHFVKSGALTVEAADNAKLILETNRFRMSFRSFGDLLE